MIGPRKTLRRGEQTEAEKQECRVKARTRVRGMCEYYLLDGTELLGVRIEASPHCLIGPLPLEGDLLTRGHLCHLKGKRVYGWRESDVQRHLWGCFECHRWEHGGGKPCPPKPPTESPSA